MKAGFQISFTYFDQEIYDIEMIEPKQQDTALMYKEEIERKRKELDQSINLAYEDLKKRIQIILDFLHKERKNCEDILLFEE